ncbi:MAG: ribonuclease Z [Bacteroidota bacterium]
MSNTDFYFQVLGANSAMPNKDRFPSSFILSYRNHLHLIDCGEGSQMKMAEYGVKRSRINEVFISHLHGDHIFGLPGVINSFTLSGRQKPLQIFGPVGVRAYIQNIMDATGARLSYELVFTELHGDHPIDLGVINQLEVRAIPLDHRITTFGYHFKEVHPEINIRPEAIKTYELTVEEIKSIKAGKQIVRNQKVVNHSELTMPPRPRRSFAYCSDTGYLPRLADEISHTSLLYHEATYLEELKEKARERRHSTAKEAATIAAMAGVRQLVIGHYSSRYKDLEPLLEEAKATFSNTEMAHGGAVFSIL